MELMQLYATLCNMQLDATMQLMQLYTNLRNFMQLYETLRNMKLYPTMQLTQLYATLCNKFIKLHKVKKLLLDLRYMFPLLAMVHTLRHILIMKTYQWFQRYPT
jgi:hypothetical protein